MGNLQDIKIKVVVCKDRAPHGSNADHLFPDTKSIDALGDKPVNEAMATTGAVAKGSRYEA
jgi:hypothetical protein